MIPYCILVIEDDDDRTFMEQLFVDYHRLMYHEIFKLVHDQWAAEKDTVLLNRNVIVKWMPFPCTANIRIRRK